MPEVHMMCGIAGSGKSRFALWMADQTGAVYVSSDDIREQWYGDSAIQGENSALFTEIRQRIRKALRSGKSVIYDATNLSRRRRIHFIRNDVRGYQVFAHTFCPSLSLCLERNRNRDRKVKESIIHMMYKSFEIPFKEEGFTAVSYYPAIEQQLLNRTPFEESLKRPSSYQEFFTQFNQLEEFPKIYELPHDTKKQSFSVSRHTSYTVMEMQKAYQQQAPLKLLWLSALHDLGKGTTKSFLRFNGEPRKYAGFEGHENVSAYLTIRILHRLAYPLDFTCSVARQVQLHHFFQIHSRKNRKQASLLLSKEEQEEVFRLQQCNEQAN